MSHEKSSKLPLVSVIIPTLELDSETREALRSICDDGYENIEIILVVDGATEPIPEDIEEYENVRVVFTGTRRGTPAAINLGIRVSAGDYIARLDSDDRSLPGRIQTQLDAFSENPNLGMVGARAYLIDDLGQRIGEFHVNLVDNNPRKTLLRRSPFVHSSVMYTREIISALGGYDESLLRMQDYELFLRMALISEMRILDDTFVEYRTHLQQNSKRMHRFLHLMWTLSKRKRALARKLGSSYIVQIMYDSLFALAQLLRYMGLRQPRYLKGVK